MKTFCAPSPANTTHRTKAVLLLAQRLRRWANIKTTLVQYNVFTGKRTRCNRPTPARFGQA